MNTCNDITILNLIYIFKSIINFIKIIVPVILVIFIIIDIIKSIASSEADSKKLSNSIKTRLIAAVIVFLIPTIINIVLNIIPNSTNLSCYQNATKERIQNLSINNAYDSLVKYKECVISNCSEKNSLYTQAKRDIKLISYNKTVRADYKKKLNSIKDGDPNSVEITKPTPVEIPSGGNTSGGNKPDTPTNPTTPSDNKCATVSYLSTPRSDVTCGSEYSATWAVNKYNGDNTVSDARKSIVRNAALYAGVIPYNWGGKPIKNGSNWTYPTTGLDCSGFVNLVYAKATGNSLGNSGTNHIWNKESYKINESDLKPGDLGFELDYDNGATENHVGIYVGKDSNGNKIWIHDEGNKYKVVVIGKYNIFKYYRRVNGMD